MKKLKNFQSICIANTEVLDKSDLKTLKGGNFVAGAVGCPPPIGVQTVK